MACCAIGTESTVMGENNQSIAPRYSVNELQKWVQKTLIENEGRLIDQAGLRVDRQMG